MEGGEELAPQTQALMTRRKCCPNAGSKVLSCLSSVYPRFRQLHSGSLGFPADQGHSTVQQFLHSHSHQLRAALGCL